MLAQDDVDSNADITASIVTTATAPLPIDTTVSGVVTIFYDVTDSFGNQAETKSRVVEVFFYFIELQKWLKTSSDLNFIKEFLRSNSWKGNFMFISPNALMFSRSCASETLSRWIRFFSEKWKRRINNRLSCHQYFQVLSLFPEGQGCPDDIPPVIILNGSPLKKNNIVQQCDEFVDPFATAFDNLDGDITANIETTVLPSPVNTDSPGIFTIFYDVMDSSGNSAETQSRVVQVCFLMPKRRLEFTSAF